MASIFNVTLINILGFICFALSAGKRNTQKKKYFRETPKNVSIFQSKLILDTFSGRWTTSVGLF